MQEEEPERWRRRLPLLDAAYRIRNLAAGVCMGIFQHDGVNRGQVETIVDSYPGQSIDFFGAMRARVYDDKVICTPTIFLRPKISWKTPEAGCPIPVAGRLVHTRSSRTRPSLGGWTQEAVQHVLVGETPQLKSAFYTFDPSCGSSRCDSKP